MSDTHSDRRIVLTCASRGRGNEWIQHLEIGGGYRKLHNDGEQRFICDGDNPLIYDYYNSRFKRGGMRNDNNERTEQQLRYILGLQLYRSVRFGLDAPPDAAQRLKQIK